MPRTRQKPEKLAHLLFEASLLFKSAFAVLELVAGLGLSVLPFEKIAGFIGWLTRAELAEDPQDLLAGALVRAAQSLSLEAAQFYAVYMVSHGALKLALLAALWRRVLWAYPVAIAVFAGFIVYQVHRYALTGSAMMLVLSAVDLLVIGLTLREYQVLKRGA